MKKVLFVTRPMVPPWHEGSKKLVWHIASRLNRFEPHLLTAPTAVYPTAQAPVKWHPVYSQAELTLAQKGRLLRFLYGRIPPVDLLHCYFVPALMTSTMLAGSRLRHRLPMVQTVPSLPVAKLTAATARRLYYGDCVVTYTAESASRLQGWGVKNVVQINVGVDLERYQKAPREAAIRAQFGCTDDDVIVLFSGEYTRLGAIDRLRKIVLQVMRQAKNVHFVFACRLLLPTDEPIKRALQKTVQQWGLSDRIHFVGEVSHFAKLLKAVDIFIYPVADMTGKIETPLTLIEAMAAGLPIVTSDIYPLKQLFPKGTALLHPPDADELVVASLLALGQDFAYRQALGQAAREYVLPRFGLAQMVAAYEAVYDSLT